MRTPLNAIVLHRRPCPPLLQAVMDPKRLRSDQEVTTTHQKGNPSWTAK